jgi:hypothetical protein
MDFMSSMLKDNIKDFYELDESETIGEYYFQHVEGVMPKSSREEIKKQAKWLLLRSSRSNS